MSNVDDMLRDIKDLRRRIDAYGRLDVAPSPASIVTYSGAPSAGQLALWSGAGTVFGTATFGTADLMLLSGAQTVGGVKTFTNGIAFANETLANYDEGTWTPVATFNNSSTGVTYSTQNGTYTRIGNRCFCTVHIELSANGSGSGVFEITGLPFVASQQSINFLGFGNSSASFVLVFGIISSGQSKLSIYKTTAAATGGTTMSDTDAGNSIIINADFMYRVA